MFRGFVRGINKIVGAMAALLYIAIALVLAGVVAISVVGIDQVINKHVLFQFDNLAGHHIAGVTAEQAAVFDNIADRIDAVRDGSNRPVLTAPFGVNSILGNYTVTFDLTLTTQWVSGLLAVIAVLSGVLMVGFALRSRSMLRVVFGA